MRLAFSVFVTYQAEENEGWHGKFERLEIWTIALREGFPIWRDRAYCSLSTAARYTKVVNELQ